MAIEYNLITPFGTGETCTFTDVGDLVNYSDHGLQNGNPVVFTSTGSLPTGITSGTTYYSRDSSVNAFTIHTTKADAIAGTGQVTFSGTGSGTHTITGEFWYSLPTTDPGGGGNYKDRYYHHSGYQAYDTYLNWIKGTAVNRDYEIAMVLEVQGAFRDTDAGYHNNLAVKGYNSFHMTSKVNGVRDPDSYHFGMIGGGYVRDASSYVSSALSLTGTGNVIDGLEFYLGGANAPTVSSTGSGNIIRNCIVGSNKPTGMSSNAAIYAYGDALITNCIFYGGTTGIKMQPYSTGSVLCNNLIFNCDLAISGANHYVGYVLNNICFDNDVNWGTAPNDGFYGNNVGESGDTIWTSSGQSSYSATTADFKNFDTIPQSDSDYSPSGDSTAHTSSSVFVDNGERTYNEVPDYDIQDTVRPSYKNGSATQMDIGPFEFDWGYGPEPLQVSINISGIIENSQIALYKVSDNSQVIAPTTVGASGVFSTTLTYLEDVEIVVKVRKGTSSVKYLPYNSPGLITESGFSLIVNQVVDPIA